MLAAGRRSARRPRSEEGHADRVLVRVAPREGLVLPLSSLSTWTIDRAIAEGAELQGWEDLCLGRVVARGRNGRLLVRWGAGVVDGSHRSWCGPCATQRNEQWVRLGGPFEVPASADGGVEAVEVLPFPVAGRVAPTIAPEDWVGTARRMGPFGRRLGAFGHLNRRALIRHKENTPQLFHITLPAAEPAGQPCPVLTADQYESVENVEAGIRELWPGVQRPALGRRDGDRVLGDLLGRPMQLLVDGEALPFNGGAAVEPYRPGFFERTWLAAACISLAM